MVMLIDAMDRREALRRIWRVFGWLLAIIAAAFLAYDLAQWQLHGGAFKTTAAGWLWFVLNKNSLLLLQPAIERHLWAPLWTILQTILAWPVFVVLGIPGAAILYSAYFRRARRQRWR
jgi:hypothetical protein